MAMVVLARLAMAVVLAAAPGLWCMCQHVQAAAPVGKAVQATAHCHQAAKARTCHSSESGQGRENKQPCSHCDGVRAAEEPGAKVAAPALQVANLQLEAPGEALVLAAAEPVADHAAVYSGLQSLQSLSCEFLI